MTTETCPHCGAEIDNVTDWAIVYKCGSADDDWTSNRVAKMCYQRQLAAKDAEIERLRKELEARGEVK